MDGGGVLIATGAGGVIRRKKINATVEGRRDGAQIVGIFFLFTTVDDMESLANERIEGYATDRRARIHSDRGVWSGVRVNIARVSFDMVVVGNAVTGRGRSAGEIRWRTGIEWGANTIVVDNDATLLMHSCTTNVHIDSLYRPERYATISFRVLDNSKYRTVILRNSETLLNITRRFIRCAETLRVSVIRVKFELNKVLERAVDCRLTYCFTRMTLSSIGNRQNTKKNVLKMFRRFRVNHRFLSAELPSTDYREEKKNEYTLKKKQP